MSSNEPKHRRDPDPAYDPNQTPSRQRNGCIQRLAVPGTIAIAYMITFVWLIYPLIRQ